MTPAFSIRFTKLLTGRVNEVLLQFAPAMVHHIVVFLRVNDDIL